MEFFKENYPIFIIFSVLTTMSVLLIVTDEREEEVAVVQQDDRAYELIGKLGEILKGTNKRQKDLIARVDMLERELEAHEQLCYPVGGVEGEFNANDWWRTERRD